MGKSTPADGFSTSQEKNPRTKSLETFAEIFMISIKKSIGLGMDLKIYIKCIGFGLLFFVISISGARS
jgi:hypothetical protein